MANGFYLFPLSGRYIPIRTPRPHPSHFQYCLEPPEVPANAMPTEHRRGRPGTSAGAGLKRSSLAQG
jgi:hypothetical protein